MKKKYICRNCGNEGHGYKDCKYPIMSFGIILLKHKNPSISLLNIFNNKNQQNSQNPQNQINLDDIEFLMVRRKHTIGYSEFIRGKYNMNDTQYIMNLFSLMTKKERELILTHDFKDLWIYMWGDIKTQYRANYERCRDKFIKLMTHKMYNLIRERDDSNMYNEQEWGFPKGRRNQWEKDIQCALREFYEETGINPKHNIKLFNIDPFNETFTAFNNNRYQHVYYLAEYVGNRDEDDVNLSKSNEISKVSWFTKNELKTKLRDYETIRMNIVDSIINIIKNIIAEYKKVKYSPPFRPLTLKKISPQDFANFDLTK